MSRIVIVVGSLRAESYNRKLAEALIRLPAGQGHDFVFANIGALPLYDQDDDDRQAESVKALKDLVAGADGVIFVTPEYNRSFPGVLKNAIDHASRPYGQSVWAGKPAGVIGVSIGAIGTALAQHHLRAVLSYLDMPTLGAPEAFLQWKEGLIDPDGTAGAQSADFLNGWLEAYFRLVARHAD